MSVIKTKLRNTLAIPMVESILGVWYSLQRRNETCITMATLPEMLSRFNSSMYDHHRNQPSTSNAVREQDEGEDDSEEFINLLQDVEELLGEPIFLTS